ncbi:MAG TPA: hypothetical protein DEP05_05890 [Betaproteobacteria bacterium]|nr:hypothetical protein [Betaproteobacteria bacterium]
MTKQAAPVTAPIKTGGGYPAYPLAIGGGGVNGAFVLLAFPTSKKAPIKTVRIFLAMLALLPWISGCLASNSPEPPLVLPFAVHRAGSTSTIKLRIMTYRTYWFDLALGFNPNDPKERDRVEKLAGSSGTDEDGTPINDGISIPVRLTINAIDAAGGCLIYDKEIRKEPLYAWSSDSYSKILARIELKPGMYRIRIENLRRIPELGQIPVSLNIGWAPLTRPPAYNGSPIRCLR